MSDMKIEKPSGIHGGFFNGPNNGPIIINPAGESEPNPFHVRKRTILPIGERGLNAVAALVTIITGVSGWKLTQHLIATFPLNPASREDNRSANTLSQPDFASIVPLILITGGVLSLAGIIWLRRCVRTRTMRFTPSSLAPTIAGVTDEQGQSRLALLRLEGTCERRIGNKPCGGRLKFYNKPTYEHYENKEGNRKRRVDYRTPTAECRRNPSHFYSIDIADIE